MEFLFIPLFLITPYLVYDFIKKPEHAVTAILLVTLINAWFIYEPFLSLGLNIYLYDPLFVAIFISALFRIFFRQQIIQTSFLWLFLGIILFANLYVGLKINGTLAGVSFRNYFFYWVGALYFMSFQYSKELLEKILKNWLKLCLVFLAIIYFRFVAEFLHLPIAQTWILSDNNVGLKFRVTHSTYAYLLSVTTVMLFARYLIPGAVKPNKIITILFIIAVLILQHRSVWAATITGVASAILLPGIKTTRLFGNLLLVGVTGLVLLLPFIFNGVTDEFLGSINEAANRTSNLNTGTFGARLKGWEYFINKWNARPLLYQLIGEPIGGSISGLKNALHNFYLQMLNDTGFLGFMCVVFFYLVTLVKLFLNIRQHSGDKLYFVMFFMLLIGQMTFYIPYSNQAQHGIILGIAASLAMRKTVKENSESVSQNTQYYVNSPLTDKL